MQSKMHGKHFHCLRLLAREIENAGKLPIVWLSPFHSSALFEIYWHQSRELNAHIALFSVNLFCIGRPMFFYRSFSSPIYKWCTDDTLKSNWAHFMAFFLWQQNTGVCIENRRQLDTDSLRKKLRPILRTFSPRECVSIGIFIDGK